MKSDKSLTTFQIWAEGYLCTGMEGIPAKAKFMGEIEAESFQDACDKFFTRNENDKRYYNSKTKSYWGCRLFDNKADARKAFG